MNFLLENWYLFVVALVSGAMLFVPALSKSGSASVTPAQAVQKMNSEKAAVVDIRSSEDYAAGHIKGAKHVSLDQVEQQLGNVAKNKATPVLFVCATGTRAGKAVAAAKKLGYEQAQVVSGGMKAWKEAGLPLTTGAKA
ncbi:rhodanese-like domain-containing protein [Lampropedia puyangensis]|uniref:Rhodanese-like domain-containing protein n=1 Tax=Lampropedia puyangensis TaxID=1330072 RepID=A0A4S8EXU4_9BURK|nr:rhodanese-like domain-containing protein [Lampropedia puyangensis]THT99396.1 rhodanese-like domain-containing protein [Lampropedia puyangensis]